MGDSAAASTGNAWQAGQQQLLQGDTAAARASFLTVLASHPGHVGARMLLASAILAEGRLREGIAQMTLAARCVGDDMPLLVRLSQALARLGDTNAARACLRHPAVARMQSGELLTALAHTCQGLGLDAEALQLMDRARALGYDTPDFRYYRGLQLQFNGRLAEAEAEIEHSLRTGTTLGRAALSLSRIHRQTPAANHVELIRSRLATVDAGTEDEAGYCFALHKELDDLGEHAQAWDALERANAVMASRIAYDPAAEERLFDGIIERFSASFLAAAGATHVGPTPIFIVGLPRSGTTLLERILGNHPLVTSAGELSDLPRQLRWTADQQGHAILDEALLDAMPSLDFSLLGRRYLEQSQWRAAGRPYYVDKLPPNFMLVGCIRRALPYARVVHIQRDAMDVCFSNFRAMFGETHGYSYAFDRLAHHHRQYARLMQHWRDAAPGFVLDLPYAELVQDTEGACRRLLEFCGLPYEAGILDHTRNTSSVATLSSAQVREPIHARALGEWRRYERQLQPLREALAASAIADAR
jgi:tetratricopeptide (TPR) repeat protein